MTWKPENEVPGYDLCKKLKELGFPQEGIWYWWKLENKEILLLPSPSIPVALAKENCLSPTIGMLGEW